MLSKTEVNLLSGTACAESMHERLSQELQLGFLQHPAVPDKGGEAPADCKVAGLKDRRFPYRNQDKGV